MEEEETLEEAIELAEMNGTELERIVNEQFPNAPELFSVSKMLSCIFEKKDPFIWFIELNSDCCHYLFINEVFPQEFAISEVLDETPRGGIEVKRYHEYKQLAYWDNWYDLVSMPESLIREWLKNKYYIE